VGRAGRWGCSARRASASRPSGTGCAARTGNPPRKYGPTTSAAGTPPPTASSSCCRGARCWWTLRACARSSSGPPRRVWRARSTTWRAWPRAAGSGTAVIAVSRAARCGRRSWRASWRRSACRATTSSRRSCGISRSRPISACSARREPGGARSTRRRATTDRASEGAGRALVAWARMPSYDAFLLVSFGGPERMEDVTPFLENVLRGRSVPEERRRAVAAHYERFSGVSPINDQNRALLGALRAEFDRHGLHLPLYWGNRNWHPLPPATAQRLAAAGISRAIAFVTSAFSSYSSCGQYLEDIAKARAAVGERAPRIDKVRVFYNHPGFIEAMADRVRAAFEDLPAGRRAAARLAFTAHSIPLALAPRCAALAPRQPARRV